MNVDIRWTGGILTAAPEVGHVRLWPTVWAEVHQAPDSSPASPAWGWSAGGWGDHESGTCATRASAKRAAGRAIREGIAAQERRRKLAP